MRTRIIFLLFALFTMNLATAQKTIVGMKANEQISGSRTIHYNQRSNIPAYVEFAVGRAYAADLGVYIKSLLKLPKEYELRRSKEEKDNIGFIHQEYQQYYKGVRVEYGMYKTHFKLGLLESINGDIYQVDDVATTPSISSAEAIVISKNYVAASKYKWQDGNANSLNYYPSTELMVLVHKHKTYLVYKVDIYAIQPLSRRYLYVDALTGEIVKEVNRIQDADMPGTANTAYSGSRSIVCDFNGVDYTLQESGRNIQTVNYATTLPYNNASTTWSLVGPDQYALDAHWATEMTYDYYMNIYGRDGLDGAHYFLTSYVNEGPGFGNAFWDGTTVHYGDGDGTTFTTPLTSIGIVAHENTHGLTQFTAGLIYAGESGAMNESFSDIFGLAVDKYARNINLSLPASWLVGAECTSGAGIRNMANPNAFGNADTYGGTFWNAGDIVHFDSGVQNFWFYLLTMGGTGTNDIANAYNVSGIGVVEAGAIAYRNLSFYLTPASDFADSRYYSLIAAEDLFGPCSPEVQSTANAWYAVGVGPPYQDTTLADFAFGNPVSCSVPVALSFTNLSTNSSSYYWDFGDGDTSTLENPSHLYAAVGSYNVTLIATGCGINVTDTIILPVVINTGSTILNIDPLQPLDISCCTGGLFDSGGPAGDYQDGEFGSARIVVPAGNLVNVVFSSFDIEDTYDFVYLYDGPNNASPLIGTYTGNALPNGGLTISSTGNEMYVEFTSDGSVTYTGFALTWTCSPPDIPTALFSSSFTTICQNGFIEYINNSIYDETVLWDFQGGSPTTSTADTVTVLYATPGSFLTTLIATNSLGSDTIVTNITVVPTPAPSISMAGNVVSVSPAFAAYQWYLNGVLIAGANSQNYTITQGGVYYCEVTDVNGCLGSSANITSTFGINSENDALVLVYPNPASVALFINNPLFINGYYRISIYNMLGEVVYMNNIASVQSLIDLASISAGTYTVKLNQDNWEINRKIVVIK